MSSSESAGASQRAGDRAAGRSAGLRMLATGAALAAAAAIGFYLVFQFTEAERQRELRDWQSRMAIVADSRFAEVQRWLTTQLDELRAIADNASVQLYMTVLHDAGTTAGDEDAPAELGYLENLLTVVSERAGFTGAVAGPEVSANVSRVGVAGLALIDRDGLVVVASPGFPALEGRLKRFYEGVEAGKSAVSRMYLNASGNAAMAFAVPVYALQSDETAASQIATVVGVKEVADELYPLLDQPGATEETAETILVRRSDRTVEYLSPLADGTGPLTKKISVETGDLAAAWAVETPGGFAIRTDYDGDRVLAMARGFEATPWTLLYKIDTAEALAESEERLRTLMIVFGLIIVMVLAGMVALWYYGTSKRASESARRFEDLAKRFEGQRNFMHLVTDSQPNSIVIMDVHGRYRWFNQKALDLAGVARPDMFNKHVTAVLGPVEGKRIAQWVQETLDTGEARTVTHTMTLSEAGERIYRSDFIPMPSREDFPPGVLMVSQDITESVNERARREATMRQLVETLVSVVDQRDPFSGHHSERVGRVAHAIAEEMDLDQTRTETARIAGNLMNLGKITVPEEVLTKRGQLTDEEFALIQRSVLESAEMVRRIDFDGPVYETLAQLQENHDGSGSPRGLKDGEIEVTARIVAVANAFVGMVSARAWREGMSFDKATEILLQEANRKFDRSVVVALVNVLDNRGGREHWAAFGEPPADEIDDTDG